MAPKRHSDRRAKIPREKPQKGGSKIFETTFSARVSYGELRPDHLKDTEPTVLHAAMVTKTELRFRSAEYLLAMLKGHLHNEVAVTYHLEAFLSAFRSTWELLGSECRAEAGFKSWYDEKWVTFASNEVGPLIKLRNQSDHMGLVAPNVVFICEMRHHADGRVETRIVVERVELEGSTIWDPLGYFDKAMSHLRAVVVEAKERKFLAPSPEAVRSITVKGRVFHEKGGSWIEGDLQDWKIRISNVVERADRPDLH